MHIFNGSDFLKKIEICENYNIPNFQDEIIFYSPERCSGHFLWIEGRKGVRKAQYCNISKTAKIQNLIPLWQNQEIQGKNFVHKNQPKVIKSILELTKKKVIIGVYEETDYQNTGNLLEEMESVNTIPSRRYNSKDIENRFVQHPNSSNNKNRNRNFLKIFSKNSKIPHKKITFNNEEKLSQITPIDTASMLGDEFMLVSGTKSPPKMNEVGTLLALETENFTVKKFFDFSEYSKIGKITKLSEQTFCACTQWDLVLMKFDGEFRVLRILQDIENGMIYDAAVFKNSIFLVSEGKENVYKELKFSNLDKF